MYFPLTPYRHSSRILTLALALGACVPAWADGSEAERSSCAGLPTQTQLKAALTQARQASNGGFNLDMWGSVVNRDGVVCAVAIQKRFGHGVRMRARIFALSAYT